MGLSCFRAISGLGWVGIGMGWDLCAGLFYEHRFAMLINTNVQTYITGYHTHAQTTREVVLHG